MNSAIAGKKQDNRSNANSQFLFRTQGIVSLTGMVNLLVSSGLRLNRVHQKPAKGDKEAQLMFVFERGKPQMTSQQESEIVEKFFGRYACVVTARNNGAVAATSEVHTGTPEHMLFSCSGATPIIGTEMGFRLNDAQRKALSSIPQVRVPLNLTSDLVVEIPSWVDVRNR